MSNYCKNHTRRIDEFQCIHPDCTQKAVENDKNLVLFCVRHGGGQRCAVHGCDNLRAPKRRQCFLHIYNGKRKAHTMHAPQKHKQCILFNCKRPAVDDSYLCCLHYHSSYLTFANS